ncbi:hypothetical protein [Methanobacterium formicicum]|uniref:CD-NTase-associated protein 15 domain-containing protein n=1 Tax=Methanobacterium formicicum (strain DSM 3637 / PP1) TaxID=1204725 RepID=K2QES8_METFP|nr:hypothetical protein [Methanobacterium formicicum]EKF86596.1 hypothetical protein A994_03908 [Methanobacterium formicicum DSM 3637]
MHSYSTDSKERKYIPLILIGVSIVFSMVSIAIWHSLHFEGLLGQIHSVIGYIVDFSAILYYDILFWLFNDYLWKYCSFIPFCNIPNLNGKWEGIINSSFKDTETKERTIVTATMDINQKWQEMEIRFKSDNSESKTVTGAFFTKNSNAKELTYQYENNLVPTSDIETMHSHDGTGWITIASDLKSLEGKYYTGRDSSNNGGLSFTKVGK